ncbi:uncharacterized protein LOC144104326 isoform X1 [Amblyomma americanum]
MHTAPRESFLQSKQDKLHFVRELCVVLQRKMEFLEGSDGTYLNLQVDNSTKVPCKIYECKDDLFDRCISCDSIPEALYRLMCAHKVCEDCLYAGETHVCRACSLKTTTEKVAEQTPEKNRGLDVLIIRCPVCPMILNFFSFMKAHILSEHQDKLEDLAKLQQGMKQEHANSGTYQDSYKRLYPDLKCSDFPQEQETNIHPSHGGAVSNETQEENKVNGGLQTCKYCCMEWSTVELRDHVVSCSKRVQNCQERKEQVTWGSYAEHHKTSTEEEARKKEGQFSSQSSSTPAIEEELERRKGIEKEVEMLKETIKNLEDKIERLETPLKNIVRELLAKQNNAYKF